MRNKKTSHDCKQGKTTLHQKQRQLSYCRVLGVDIQVGTNHLYQIRIKQKCGENRQENNHASLHDYRRTRAVARMATQNR